MSDGVVLGARGARLFAPSYQIGVLILVGSFSKWPLITILDAYKSCPCVFSYKDFVDLTVVVTLQRRCLKKVSEDEYSYFKRSRSERVECDLSVLSSGPGFMAVREDLQRQ